MIIRVYFGRGRPVTRRKGKNARAAMLLASLLSLISISLAVLGFWRLGQDLEMVGNFVFVTGLLSHWQVWLAAAAVTQYACWWLTRYSRYSNDAGPEATSAPEEETPARKVAARV